MEGFDVVFDVNPSELGTDPVGTSRRDPKVPSQGSVVRREDLETRILSSPWEFLETLRKVQKEVAELFIVGRGKIDTIRKIDVGTRGEDLHEKVRSTPVRLSKG